MNVVTGRPSLPSPQASSWRTTEKPRTESSFQQKFFKINLKSKPESFSLQIPSESQQKHHHDQPSLGKLSKRSQAPLCPVNLDDIKIVVSNKNVNRVEESQSTPATTTTAATSPSPEAEHNSATLRTIANLSQTIEQMAEDHDTILQNFRKVRSENDQLAMENEAQALKIEALERLLALRGGVGALMETMTSDSGNGDNDNNDVDDEGDPTEASEYSSWSQANDSTLGTVLCPQFANTGFFGDMM